MLLLFSPFSPHSSLKEHIAKVFPDAHEPDFSLYAEKCRDLITFDQSGELSAWRVPFAPQR